MWHLPLCLGPVLEVWKAAWVLFVAGGDSEERFLELTVAELLKRHSSRNSGENWDICNTGFKKKKKVGQSMTNFHLNILQHGIEE